MMKKRMISLLLVIGIWVQICGFSFSKTTVAIDTEKNRVYQYVTVDTVMEAFTSDEVKAKKEYADGYYLLSGTIDSIKEKGKSVTLSASKGDEKIVCPCDKEIRGDVLQYHTGDSVALFGKMTIDFIDKEKHISVEKIVKAPSAVKSSEIYYTLDGNSFDYTSASVRTLGNGRVEYRIPLKWNSIEVNITDEGIGTIEGCQYVLNKTSGEESAEPESLFVCYFDKKLLKEADDIQETKDVEKTIIENIDGNVGKFPVREQDTYYGTEYKYYLGRYTDALETGKGYRTEYVFQEDGDNGIILYLYVYRETTHLSDVMFVTRFLKIK